MRGSFLGEEVVFSPERGSSLDEAKDTLGVDIVAVRESVAEDNGLEGRCYWRTSNGFLCPDDFLFY